MDPFTWLLAGLLVGAITGVIKGIAAQHEAESAAAVSELEAEKREKLTEEGGYYDDELAALQADLDDITNDRKDAEALLKMTETELKGEIEQTFLQEKARITGLEAQAKGLEAQKVGQIVSGLEIAAAGAQAVGEVKAAAGAGGLAQTGSVLRRSEAIARTVGRRIAATNLGIQATQAVIGATGEEMTAVKGAYALQRGRLQNDITRSMISYQDALRGLTTRQATTEAKETLVEVEKASDIKEAELLRSEAEWLKTWGVTLGWASALTGGLTTAFGISSQNPYQVPGSSRAEAAGMTGIRHTPYRDEEF